MKKSYDRCGFNRALSIGLSAVALCLWLVPIAAAETVVSSITTSVDGGTGVGIGDFQAQRFTLTGGPWQITSISAFIDQAPGSSATPQPQISIFTDNTAATTPGTSLFTYSNTPATPLITSGSTISFTGSGTQILSSGTYWIAFGSAGDDYRLPANDSSVTNTGTHGTAELVRRSSFDGGATWTGTDRTFLWSINATTVPEPATISLIILGGIGMIARHRRGM